MLNLFFVVFRYSPLNMSAFSIIEFIEILEQNAFSF